MTETNSTKIDWKAKDKARADEIIDTLISWTNADDEDAITLGRNDCCYIRDEIERLRDVENALHEAGLIVEKMASGKLAVVDYNAIG